MNFEAGKTYATRSFCDYDHIIAITVVARTEKTIKTSENKTLRVKRDFRGNEMVKPWGSYSMAPMITADRATA